MTPFFKPIDIMYLYVRLYNRYMLSWYLRTSTLCYYLAWSKDGGCLQKSYQHTVHEAESTLGSPLYSILLEQNQVYIPFKRH